jgi:uncharacterized tellurite resistance protein B-like protein
MFFRRTTAPSSHSSHIDQVVSQALPTADAETRRIVTAVAALLGSVAYADRQFAPAEQQALGRVLQGVQGIGPDEAKAILAALSQHLVLLSAVETPRHARHLKELADRDLRLHVLELMMQVATSDGELTHTEVTLLRQLTTALGLEQSDYNHLQQEHRHLLSTLKSS